MLYNDLATQAAAQPWQMQAESARDDHPSPAPYPRHRCSCDGSRGLQNAMAHQAAVYVMTLKSLVWVPVVAVAMEVPGSMPHTLGFNCGPPAQLKLLKETMEASSLQQLLHASVQNACRLGPTVGLHEVM